MIKSLKVTILLIGVSLFASGCSKGGGGDSAASAEASLVGEYFMSGSDASGDFYYTTAIVEPNNNLTFIEMYSPRSNPSHFYYRKKVGFFSKNNDQLVISWTYETCNPVLGETVKVTGDNPTDRIFVTIGVNTYQMLNLKTWTSAVDFANSFFVLTEDVNCDVMPD